MPREETICRRRLEDFVPLTKLLAALKTTLEKHEQG